MVYITLCNEQIHIYECTVFVNNNFYYENIFKISTAVFNLPTRGVIVVERYINKYCVSLRTTTRC